MSIYCKESVVFTELTIQSKMVDPTYITEQLNLDPFTTHCMCDKTEYGDGFYSENIWEIRTQEEESNHISIQLNKLFGLFNDKIETLANIKKKYSDAKITISVVIYSNGELPTITLSAEEISFLSIIGASLDFDIYGYNTYGQNDKRQG